jgi:four helix bundle protein
MIHFKNMVVWEKSMQLADQVYEHSEILYLIKKFALGDQMCRSALSIPSNIAEGSGRTTDKDKGKFMSIALGSSYELESQLLLCKRRKYLQDDILNELLNLLMEVQKMLLSFRKKLIGI